MSRERSSDDPLFRHSRREASLLLAVWVICLLYTTSYCYLFGYLSHEPLPNSLGPSLGEIVGPLQGFQRDLSTLTTPLGLGIPDWIFFGVLVPWILSIAFTVWFCLFYFEEDDLGRDPLGEDHDED